MAAAVGAELGERPVWDPNTGCLIWVDINAGELHQLRAEARMAALATASSPGQACQSVPPLRAPAAATSSRRLTGSGCSERTALRRARRLRPPGMPANVRFNDGACDPAGRFWAGTTATDGQAGSGSLYRLDPDGSVTEVLGGVTESNGLGWSPDATVFYYTDSGEAQSRVRAFSFDLPTGHAWR